MREEEKKKNRRNKLRREYSRISERKKKIYVQRSHSSIKFFAFVIRRLGLSKRVENNIIVDVLYPSFFVICRARRGCASTREAGHNNLFSITLRYIKRQERSEKKNREKKKKIKKGPRRINSLANERSVIVAMTLGCKKNKQKENKKKKEELKKKFSSSVLRTSASRT